VRHKTFYPFALFTGMLLVMAIAVRSCAAAEPWDSSDNPSGAGSSVPTSTPMSRYDMMRQVVPGAPVQPAMASRPSTWPGGTIPATQPAVQPPAAVPGLQGQVELFEDTTIIARVGSEGIFASEIMGTSIVWKNAKKSEGGVVCAIMDGIDELLEPYKDKMPASQFDKQRTLLIKQRLINRIESRIIYMDAKQSFPAEHFGEVEKQMDKFYESTALPALYKCCEVKSTTELDQKLHKRGLSLDYARKSFREWILVQQFMGQQIKRDDEITYDQMHKYYQDHLSEFEKPAQAKWEELMVQFSKFRNKEEAYEAIARLGNQVFSGADFAAVARNGSQGLTAANGGEYPWTTKGSLKYAEIDQAIFELPEKQLSQIIETEKGYHIIRVIERIETDRTSFRTAQVDIKEKIIQERTNKQLKDYLDRLENKIPVWTVYDGDRKDIRLEERMKEIAR
jgi:PPIC-type PPIASE domain